MPRLYFRFYAALLASLALLTVAVGLLWHYAGEPIELPERTLGTVLRNALPPENAPAEQQQAALARLTRGLRADKLPAPSDSTPVCSRSRRRVTRRTTG